MTIRHFASLSFVAVCVLVLAGGCDREDHVTSGGDSGVDAGRPDSGIDDAGTDDASADDAQVDGGMPDPAAVARDEARADLATLETTLAAVDPSLRAVNELVRVDVIATRIDGVIGEKIGSPIDVAGVIGEKTPLAFRLPLAAVVVIVRELRTALVEIGDVVSRLSASAEPSLVALRDALTALAASVQDVLTSMLARWDELVSLYGALPGTEDLGYHDVRRVHTVPQQSTVYATLEASVSAPQATVLASCDGGATGALAFTVHDDRDNTEILPVTMGSTPISFGLPLDRPTVLRIDVFQASPTYDSCTIDVSGRRHTRDAPIPLSSAEITDLQTRADDWDGGVARLVGALSMMRTDGNDSDRALAPMLESYLREASAESGFWRGSPSRILPEDLDVLELTLTHVIIPLGALLETSPETSAAMFGSTVATELAALRMHNEAALTALSTP